MKGLAVVAVAVVGPSQLPLGFFFANQGTHHVRQSTQLHIRFKTINLSDINI